MDNRSKPQQPSGEPSEIAPNAINNSVNSLPNPLPQESKLHESTVTTDVLQRVLQPDRKDKQYPNLFQTKESSQSEQALDVTAFPELNLPIRKIMTPSGMRDVICFMDTTNMEIRPSEFDYAPHYDLPEIGHVWGTRSVTSAGVGDFTPLWSARTLEQMKFCSFFHGACLVRLICKPPLVTSQTFWVFRSAKDDTSVLFRNEIGFAWRPSVQNEVFCLMPWASINNTLAYNIDLRSAFLRLGIRPLSSLVSEPGTASTLDVNVYFAPYQVRLFVPRPVTSTVNSPITTQLLDPYPSGIPPDDTELPVTIGMLTTDSTIVVLNTLLNSFTDTNNSYRIETTINGADSSTFDLNDNTDDNSGRFNTNALTLPPGTYPIQMTRTGPGRFELIIEPNGLQYLIASRGPAIVTITPMTTQATKPVIPTPKKINLEGWNYKIFIDPRINDPTSQLSNGLNLSKQKFRFESEVVSQSPSEVRAILYVNDVRVGDFISDTFKRAKSKLSELVIPNCNYTLEPVLGKQQIFEYEYNTRSQSACKYYGYMGDHSIREDTHWQQEQSVVVTEATKNQIFTFNFSLLPTSGSTQTALREVSRHLLKTRLPNVKIQCVKTPFTNGLVRIVKGPLPAGATVDDVMQLPGHEWDLSGEYRVEPYWDRNNPSSTDISFTLNLIVLSATISDVGFELISFYNTGNLEYFHMRDYDLPVEIFQQQSSGMMMTLDMSNTHRVDNVSRHENTGMMADQIIKPHDASETKMGSVMRYVGTFSVPLDAPRFMYFPINHTLFSKVIVNTAKKYVRWRGNPKFHINFTTNVTQATPAFVSQVDREFAFDSNDKEAALFMFPNSRSLVRNDTTEFICRWRVPSGSPWQNVVYDQTPQLGWLCFTFPFASQTLAALDAFAKVTIYCDTADFEYSIASSPTSYNYPGPQRFDFPVITAIESIPNDYNEEREFHKRKFKNINNHVSLI